MAKQRALAPSGKAKDAERRHGEAQSVRGLLISIMAAAGYIVASLLEQGPLRDYSGSQRPILRNGRYTKDKLAAQRKRGEVGRQVNAALKLIEQRLIEAGPLDF